MFSKALGYLGVFCGVGLLGFALLKLLAANQPQQSSASNETNTTVEQSAPVGHTLRLQPNLLSNGAVSDGRTYSVLLIDENKNSIPTDTDLFVQGTMLTAKWSQDGACTQILISGHANIQHGDNPAAYCRFSIWLTEKRKGGGDMWPAAALICDLDPQEFMQVTKLYRYGDEVQAHGRYAASLDFGVVPGLGAHFGVPVLEECTFADPTNSVVRSASE